jgi:type IV pilus assembly protein PilQ
MLPPIIRSMMLALALSGCAAAAPSEPNPGEYVVPDTDSALERRTADSVADAPPAGAAAPSAGSGAPVAPQSTGRPISLDLKDADIRNVLRLIGDVGGLSIVATDDVEGRVTLHLSGMPWDAALATILRSLSLGSREVDGALQVSTLKRLREEDEEAKLAEDASRAVEPLLTDYLRIKYVKAAGLADILRGGSASAADAVTASSHAGLLSPRGSVVVDMLSNTMIVRDVEDGVERARELVRRLDVPVNQVLIEASIVETTADFGRSLGIQWGYRASIGPDTGTSTGKNFPGTIDAGGSGLGTGSGGVPFIVDLPGAVVPGAGSALDLALGSLDGSQALDLRLTALEREGKARIISRPRIVTLNNVAATIKSLTVLRVKLPSTDTIVGGEGEIQQSTATERIETGIILIVTPQVSSDRFVLLDLFAKSSQADFTRTVDGIPTETSREANSHVLVEDGHTVVLGGIYAETRGEEETGMPFLRGLPGLSWLFTREDKTDRREDLLVFLTPHILPAGGKPLPPAAELWQDRGRDGETDAARHDSG